MKRRRSLYARPNHFRGQQCAEAPLDPGGATKQLPARRYLALEGGRTAEPAWAVERRRRRPQEHGWASQRAVARRGGPGGPDTGRAFVTLSTSSASVRCPVSDVGVRCLCVAACAVSGRSEVLERGVGRQPYGWDGRGRRGRPLPPCRLVVGLSRRLVLEAGAGGAGPAEVSVWIWPSSWEVVGQWPGRPRGRPG